MEESERRLSITSLALLFLLGVGVCAVFFSLGFLVGYKERSSSNSSEVERVTPSATAPPVVNPPPEKDETSFKHAAPPVAAGPTVQSPVAESAQKSQPRPDETSGNVASATRASAQDASSGANPPAAQRTAAAPRNPDSPQAPGFAPTKQPATGSIVLQVAALQSIEDARRMVKVLKERGYPVFLVTPEDARAGDNLFRVRVGPFTLRDEAEKTRQKLVTEGFNPFIKR